MKKRSTGYKAHGQGQSIVRSTRLSLELDARLDRVSSSLEVSKSQTIAECCRNYVVQLEYEHGIGYNNDSDCAGVVDSIDIPEDTTKAVDNDTSE